MLKKLQIKNIILIQSATLTFDQGFYIFSGETGAGKTAILQALSLILGSRLDPQIIRMGEDEALVEAHFDLPKSSEVYRHIKDAGLEIDASEELLIQREIKLTGKSKISINCQWAPLHLLKKIAPHLIEVVSQHGTQKLFELETHRSTLDRFGDHLNLTKSVSLIFNEVQNLKNELYKLEEDEKESSSLKERWTVELKEIEEAKIQSSDEEEKLFEVYQRLAQSKERIQALSEVTDTLQETDPSLLSTLGAQLTLLSKYTQADPKLDALMQVFKGATEELKEVSLSLLNYRDQIENDPETLLDLDERLKLLNHLKKRYGPSLKEVIEFKENLSKKLLSHLDLSQEKERLTSQITKNQIEYNSLANQLTKKREQAKGTLEVKIKGLFNLLNLQNAAFEIDLTKGDPSPLGNESVEFFLKANLGEKRTSLREKVSGGELSRVLLALKVLLSDLEETPTLIFDEIDTNLGGETAPKIGKLLKQVSQSKQVIAITHLPQVAVCGTHHYLIHKEQEKERTYSLINLLSDKQKIQEIERMLGGKNKKAKDLAKDLLQSS